ncbi:MAG: hypothetical protein HS117_07265 [Verrucomicrobiaceae bacterium]|nr:hypothetical protein [Verrucomicrobiaceae bacterium]
MKCLAAVVMLLSWPVLAQEVSFIPRTGAPALAEVDVFDDRPCDLSWRVLALPESEIVIRGQVFQASSSLAVPLKDLSFELKTRVEAGKVTAEAHHTLNLPSAGRVQGFLVKWQSGTASGNIVVRTFPDRVLPAYPPVTIDEHDALQPLREAFEAKKIALSADWKGIRFTKAKSAAEVEQFKSQALAVDQCHVVFTDLPGLHGSVLVKPAGAGRLIIVPSAFLTRFPTSPLVQQSILDLSKP